jgi:hypothetical protein
MIGTAVCGWRSVLAHQAIQLGVRGILRKTLPCELLQSN